MKLCPRRLLSVIPVGVCLVMSSSILGCGDPLAADPEPPPEATSALESRVDVFDDGSVSDWKPFTDGGGSTLSHRLSSSRANSGSTSMKVTYRVVAGGYAGVERSFATPANWSSFVALTAWFYGGGTGHQVTVQIYDAGGERWSAAFPVSFVGWKRITLPFASFRADGWQPAGVVVNGALDLDGVVGLALLPAGSGRAAGAAGAIYVDSLVTVDAAGAAGEPLLPPVPPVAAPVAPPVTGTIVPLYGWPGAGGGAWDAVFAAKAAHPKVNVVAVVNADNGPGDQSSATYTEALSRLVAAGIKVIGYVATSYGARSIAEVQADIDRWVAFYPQATGVFFDEQASHTGGAAYYNTVAAYARSRGLTFSIGNPGKDTEPEYVGACDVTLIYENSGLPSDAALGGWHTAHDRKYFGAIPYGVPTLSNTFVQNARKYVGYLYVQNDVLPNPWDSIPPYFGALVAALDSGS